MSTNTYLFSIKAFSIFDIFSAAYYYLYFSIFLFSESLSKMPRQAGDKRPRLDEDGDQEVLIFTVCIYVFMYMYMYMYICICIYVYVYMYICIFTDIYYRITRKNKTEKWT